MAQAPRLHVRVAVGACLRCHVPIENAEHSFTLAPASGGVCRSCHPFQERKQFIHAPFHDLKCVSCHDPHGRDSKAHLVEEDDARLCGRCHEAREAKVMHGPYAEGQCLACHDPHQSEFRALTRARSIDLCLRCHDKRISTDDGQRIVANIAAVLESSAFKHGPIREGECSGCHWAHGSPNSNLLHENFPPDFYQDYDEAHYALCFQCHQSALVLEERTTTLTNFRDGDRNLHYVHVHREKGRSCRACHEVHASNLPFHIRETVWFGRWELPIDFRRTETGGLCKSGCHKETEYRHERNVGDD